VLFIIDGIASIHNILAALADRQLHLDLGVLALFVGFGLLRLRPGWRTCGLVFTWIGMLVTPLVVLVLFQQSRPADFRLLGEKLFSIPVPIAVLFCAVIFTLLVWQYRVLTRPDIRALFLQHPPDRDEHLHDTGNQSSPWFQSLLVSVVVILVLGDAVLLYRYRAPSSYGASQNHHFKPFGSVDTAVPAFEFGAFHFYDRPPTIGYFVRIDDPRDLPSPTPWLKEDDGRIYVNGRRILPRNGVVQLFVAEGAHEPQLVILTDADRQEFLKFIDTPTNFDDCALFWNAVLRTNHLPELSPEEMPPRVAHRGFTAGEG
jgi:hypothetical protein